MSDSLSRRRFLGAAAVTVSLPVLLNVPARAEDDNRKRGGDAPAKGLQGWVPTVKAADLADGKMVTDYLKEYRFALVRQGNRVYALDSICSHKGSKTKAGEGNTLFCGAHSSRFDLEGKPTSGPAKRPLLRHPLRVNKDGIVEVDVDPEHRLQADDPIAVITLGNA